MQNIQSENNLQKMRCPGKYAKDPLYLKYHDEEWGRPLHDEKMLYEMFVIELFQAGLSWRTFFISVKILRRHMTDLTLKKLRNMMRKKCKSL